jgi:hypothetical protein
MNLRNMSWVSLLIIAFALPVVAQTPIIEYGRPDELRGVTKIFVDTGIDAQEGNLIVKVIRKRLPNLEVVSRPEDADIHLRFAQSETSDVFTKGVGTVVKLVGDNRERVLLRIKNVVPPLHYEPIVSYAMWYARPLMIARQFVRTYRRVNS